jgi:flagellar hook-associated protein 2
MISAPGIGSGLDINSLVQQLVAAEGDAKTKALVNKRSAAEEQISAFGKLKSNLSAFQTAIQALKDPDTFSGTKATSGEPSVFSVATTASLNSSSFQVEVNTLAEAHRIVSPGVSDADTVVGTGELTLQVGTDAFTLTIDEDNNTLAGIRDAINTSTDNTGITATIINVDDGSGGTESRLVLTSDKTGTANSITVTVTDDDLNNTDANGLSALVFDPDGSGITNASETNAAVDSVIFIDGQKVTGSSNTVDSAIDGVSISLLEARPGETFSLDITLDKSKITNAVKTLVDNFNALARLMKNLSVFNAETGEAGVLLGDITLLSLNTTLRRQLGDSVQGITGEVNNLVSLGITTNADGTLKLDSSKLSGMVDSNLQEVTDIFSSEDGIAERLDNFLDGYLKSNGVIQGKTDGLNNTVEDINESLVDLDRRLETMRQRLQAQFAAMDALVSRLNSTSSFLTRELANIPVPGKNN